MSISIRQHNAKMKNKMWQAQGEVSISERCNANLPSQTHHLEADAKYPISYINKIHTN